MVLSAAIFVAAQLSNEVESYVRKPYQDVFRTFALTPLNVLNVKDIELGFDSFVIVKIDSQGNPVRVVKALDRQGGRLDYLRNDMAYFRVSLKWQRTENIVRYESDRAMKLRSKMTTDFFAYLDACEFKEPLPAEYRTYFFRRSIDTIGDFPTWTDSQFRFAEAIVVAGRGLEEEGKSIDEICEGIYALPPGHFQSARRQRQTLEEIRQITL